MVRLAPEIRAVAEQFVRLRLSNLRGLDLNVFDFDYDLTWVALMLTAEGKVLGRFGGRDASSASVYLSLPGLRHSLERALEKHRKEPKGKAPLKAARLPEDYPAARKMGAATCIHCHHVHEFQREKSMAEGTWNADQELRYPDPALLGFQLDARQGDQINRLDKGSTADRAGIMKGDVVVSIGGHALASILDVQHALDRAPAKDDILLVYRRGSEEREATLRPDKSWRERMDISWRWSLKNLKPEPPVAGEDLGAGEKKSLGLAPDRLAFRQGPFLATAARQAGVQVGDIFLRVGPKDLALTARQFDTYFRLHFKSGDEVPFLLLRGKEKLNVTIKVP